MKLELNRHLTEAPPSAEHQRIFSEVQAYHERQDIIGRAEETNHKIKDRDILDWLQSKFSRRDTCECFWMGN